MSRQKNITLLVLLVAQAVLIAFLYRPGHNAAKPATDLFTGVVPDQVKTLSITDDEGKNIQLTKKEHWTIGPEGFPADNDKVEDIIKKISELKSSRLISRSKSSHSRLKVGEEMFNRRVDLSTDKNISFYLGTAPSSKSIHLRRQGENEVYKVNGLSSWELQADKESWWQSKYVALDSADLRSLILTNQNGKIELIRGKDNNWQLQGVDKTLDQKKVDQLLGPISRISIAEYLGKDFSPAVQATSTIEYKTGDSSFTLEIWPQDEKNSDHVVKLSSSTFYAKIRAYIMSEPLKVKEEDLVANGEKNIQKESPEK